MIASPRSTEVGAEVYTLLIPGTKQVSPAKMQMYIFSQLMSD